MKKIALFGLIALVVSQSCIFALPSGNKTIFLRSTTGGTTLSADMAGVAGRRIVVDSIYGVSDLATSVFTIQESSDGTTYTVKYTHGCGATSAKLGTDSQKPVFSGRNGYYYKVQLNCTTADSLMVNYHDE